jgi:type II secretory pathway pseudopilin PulG
MQVRRHTPRHDGAFTLVEMLLSVALTIMVLAIVLQMTNSSMKAVGDATGAMSANEKYEQLRSRLNTDLSRVPWPTTGNATLEASLQQSRWSLRLLLPVTRPTTAVAWTEVNYEWNAKTQVLTRSEQSPGATAEVKPHEIARGILELSTNWLSTVADGAGTSSWSNPTALPAAVKVEVKLVGEHDRSEVTAAQEQKARSFQWSMNVGG